MDIILQETDFVNDKFSVRYGTNKEALFTIVDETFPGLNHVGRVNHITIMVRTINPDGSAGQATLQSSVLFPIGTGNRVVGCFSDDPTLWGKRLSRDTMNRVTVRLYED